MSQPDPSIEQTLIAEIAADYRAKGYSVVTHPTGADLPGFLGEYQPDLIARGPSENLVIEVKAPSFAADAEQTRAIADRLSQVPGWRFVVVVPPPAEELLPGEHLAPLDEAAVRRQLQEADALQGTGHNEAALMLAWAATEAALRLVAERENIRLRRPDTLTLLRELASEGIVDRAHFRQLSDLFRVRSALAHGFQSKDTGRGENGRAALQGLTHFVESLLAEERMSA